MKTKNVIAQEVPLPKSIEAFPVGFMLILN